MQLTSLTATSSLVHVALFETADACNGYLFCHCNNDDDKPNGEAKNTACARYAIGQSDLVPVGDASDRAQERHYTGTDGLYYGKA
ncbi:uncharacterized protein ColSpa_08938 [Colletotrichum spaethianum]|uniref:Uncharacterized protein n=1 Tax=Colletotrichum spaethianum TaxID=700344 RepID=A0AA37PAQ0_9PEZI|nr:uncharacterized protein ColSpa_08938 [Colletotrichum spaethianum]GKT48757.1 hypothetical protein ColSpa_08938 [Colletotrichum spaethianum]